jgi:siroheme synthase (precorrin-2 oxidase/ferrochelatase)
MEDKSSIKKRIKEYLNTNTQNKDSLHDSFRRSATNSAKKEKKEIELKKDFSEYQFVNEFIDPENPSIAYQMRKNKNYLFQQYSEIDKLNKD